MLVEVAPEEGERQRARRPRQADRLAQREVERGERVGDRWGRILLEGHGIEEAGKQRLLVGRDRAHVLAEGQRDLRRVPVAAPREAEDPCGQGG